MSFIVLGKCVVTKQKKIKGSDKNVKITSEGPHIILYNVDANDLMYVTQSGLAGESGEEALKLLVGYTMNKGKTFVLDENIKEFKGQLINYTKETDSSYWAIVSINDDAVKLVNLNGDIKVVNTDNFKRLRLFNRIVNIWEKEDATIDTSKYNKLDGLYQVVEILTDGMEVPAVVEIEQSLKKNNIDISINKIKVDANNINEKNKQSNRNIGNETLQSIASINGDKIKQVHLESGEELSKYNIYKYIIENIQCMDVISIPNDVFKQLSTNVHRVLSSTFKTNGEYKEFKWIASVKFESNSEKSVIGVVKFDDESEYIKLQAFSIYEFNHNITYNDIEAMYTKRKMEMKYL